VQKSYVLILAALSPYHRTVAVQKNRRDRTAPNSRKKTAGKSFIYLFWFVFFIVILLLFIINWKTIRDTVNNTGLLDKLTRRNTEAPVESPPEEDLPVPEDNAPPVVVVGPEKPADDSALPTEAPEPAAPVPAAEPVKPPEPAPKPPATEPQKPAADTPKPAPRTVERSIYLIKFDEENGVVLRTKVSRTLPVTDSPLLDVLNVLLRGPTAAEERQKLRSLIPSGTRLLSAMVRGSTAYVSFSEDFQINTDGIEGYHAQLQQLVWTITEFPNVEDVQFLIEGRRVDYLGEGIRLGSPLSRSNF
jgi:hypothetical protein